MLWLPNLTDYVKEDVYIDCEYFSEFFQSKYTLESTLCI